MTSPNPTLNRAIVDHLRKAGPCSALALMDLFCEGESEDARRAFRKRLNYLADAGALIKLGSWHGCQFDAGPPGAYIPGVDARRVRGPAKAPPQPPANVTPPRQVQVMFGPVYMPPRAPALRPGALDFKACASRGHRC